MLCKGDRAEAVAALRLSEELGYKSSAYAVAQTGFAYQVMDIAKMRAGEDISAATIASNMFFAPVLAQPEFVELRTRLGFSG